MTNFDARKRAVITAVSPIIEEGRFAVKRIIGDEFCIGADCFTDGHSQVAVQLLYKKEASESWNVVPMQPLENDRFEGSFMLDTLGTYLYTLRAWVDHFRTWQVDLEKKVLAGLDVSSELLVGQVLIKRALVQNPDPDLEEVLDHFDVEQALDVKLSTLPPTSQEFITVYDKILSVTVDPRLAQFSSWYELFPRSCSSRKGQHGTLKECLAWVDEIASMGFDVLYLPPIHPIGEKGRKGRDNHLQATEDDPGSPWAIGSSHGGHKAIHPSLGTLDDFEALVQAAEKRGVHIAMDLAFQCSPDHPYLKEHPDWFLHRPDGTIQHAENPPKKYEDIVPFNFETEAHEALWEELASIVFFWIDKGVRLFRVDNPHTKPFAFWQWLIQSVKKKYPEVLFLSEAFTRPNVMHWLAKLGFSQSYTYFTWRYTKGELSRYMALLTEKSVTEYFRPNLWPNTPDILAIDLQYDGQAAFSSRLILAATLSSNYGVYGPPYEALKNDSLNESEEYLHAEKYEVANWDLKSKSPIKELMTKLNLLRRHNPALQKTNNLKFLDIGNPQLLYFAKFASRSLLIVVSVDPFEVQSADMKIPLEDLGLSSDQSYRVHELLEDRHHIWEGDVAHVTIDPKSCPARIYQIQTPLRREKGFEYFM